MNPSQMTDAELRLAIAEKLGLNVNDGDWYCPKCDVLLSPEQVTFNEKHDKGSCLCPVEWRTIPNWPNDIAAALGLLEDMGEWRIGRVNILVKGGWKYWCTVDYKYDPKIKELVPNAFATSEESLSRAISEAAYMAMKEE